MGTEKERLAKPPFGSPCNHCGLCCRLELCPVAVIAFPNANLPCPALTDENRCGLVLAELAAGMEPLVANGLGIGSGCSMDDELQEAV